MIDIKPLKLIHGAFCTAIVMFMLVVLMITKDDLVFEFPLKNMDVLGIIAPLFLIGGTLMGNFLFKTMLSNIDPNSDPNKKFTTYQTAFLIKCALIEGTTFFNIVICLISYNALFILFSVVGLIVLWQARPIKESIYATLQIQDTNPF